MAAFSFMSKRYIHSNRLENVHRERERMISGALYYGIPPHVPRDIMSCCLVLGSFSVTKGGFNSAGDF